MIAVPPASHTVIAAVIIVRLHCCVLAVITADKYAHDFIRGFSDAILSFGIRPVQLIDTHHKLIRADLLDYLTGFPILMVGGSFPLCLGYDFLSALWAAQTVSDTENAANDSTTAELPGGSVDYSIYEPYGLSYDQENYYFTYNGNVVRFFNDPIAGASFTNFFSGTVDIEADRDEENNLVGIKECSKENYDRHTQKHNNFNPTDTSLSTVQKGESTPQLWLKDYADYGITYNEQSGGWYYNNQRIKILLDSEQAVVYTDEENGVCVTISRDGNHQISEIKEISETDAQSLMLKNNPIGEDYTSQE